MGCITLLKGKNNTMAKDIYLRAPDQPFELARRARGWTQRALSTESGISAQEICRIERGWLRPTPRQSAKLAAALGLHPDELCRPAVTKAL
jgi:transcriptional regulator with XRE-family HTH domain